MSFYHHYFSESHPFIQQFPPHALHPNVTHVYAYTDTGWVTGSCSFLCTTLFSTKDHRTIIQNKHFYFLYPPYFIIDWKLLQAGTSFFLFVLSLPDFVCTCILRNVKSCKIHWCYSLKNKKNIYITITRHHPKWPFFLWTDKTYTLPATNNFISHNIWKRIQFFLTATAV